MNLRFSRDDTSKIRELFGKSYFVPCSNFQENFVPPVPSIGPKALIGPKLVFLSLVDHRSMDFLHFSSQRNNAERWKLSSIRVQFWLLTDKHLCLKSRFLGHVFFFLSPSTFSAIQEKKWRSF